MSGLLTSLLLGFYCLTTHDIRHEKGHEFITLEDSINVLTVQVNTRAIPIVEAWRYGLTIVLEY